MSNPLYQQLNPQQPQQNQFNQFMQNPAYFLAQKGINVPQNIQYNPKAIIQNMLDNGTISQQQFNEMLNRLMQSGLHFS